MSNTPTQYRTVDPYASFDSNIVTSLTRIVTDSTNAISNSYPIEVILDPANPTERVILKQGIAFKDDILIQIDEFIVDFNDIDCYSTPSVFNESGYYYLLLSYGYTKTRPAPIATIKILKPSERGAFNYSQYIMLKIVNVIYTGSDFEIDELMDYDPENPENKVIWTKNYASKEAYLPTFDSNFDVGKIVHDRRNGIFFLGTPDGWREMGVFDYPCNTSGCLLGEAVYLDNSNIAHPAIATALDTLAYGFVIRIGDDTEGVVRFTGRLTGGLVETSITLSVGDFLYLSDTQAGRVTNVAPTNIDSYTQAIGKCIDLVSGKFSTILTYLGATLKTIPHNSLLDVQGGDTTSRYHLNLTNYNHVTNQDFTHNNLTSKQGGDGTNYYHIGLEMINNLGDGSHDSLSGVFGGDSTGAFHLTLSDMTHVTNQDFNHSNLSNKLGGDYHLTYSQYSSLTIFAPGTRLLFPQSSAPAGWTQITSMNDRVIRLVSGTGGGTGGGWTITGLTTPDHYHGTYSHILSIDEIPNHTHSAQMWVGDGGTNNGFSGSYTASPTSVWFTVSSTGGGGAHTHGNTTTASTIISSDSNWRPSYFDVIMAQKS